MDVGIGVAIGILIGFFISIIFKKKKSIGDLVVDRSDEDGPLLFLELNEPLSLIESQKSVMLNVIHKNYISQK